MADTTSARLHPNAKDLTGQRFGLLTVANLAGRAPCRQVLWACRCDCGGEKVTTGNLLRSGKTQSCGCRLIAFAGQINRRHGHNTRDGASPTYRTWQAMLRRTTNPRDIGWRLYGGRGITVCERWRSFENFLADMGERPAGLTLDREDNDDGYHPGNCRWATWSEQRMNQRRAA